MIEQLLKDLRQMSEDERHQRNLKNASENRDAEQNQTFLAALVVAQKAVRRKLFSFGQAEELDLTQSIALRLWSWRAKYREKSERMSPDEWQSFAARTAYNELNRHFSQKSALRGEALDVAKSLPAEQTLAGDSDAEFESLARFVWQAICPMSLRQRRALLLHSQELIVYVLQSAVTEAELLEMLEIDFEQWIEIRAGLPLTDAAIARIGARSNRGSVESTAKSIKKARHEARAKIKQYIEK